MKKKILIILAFIFVAMPFCSATITTTTINGTVYYEYQNPDGTLSVTNANAVKMALDSTIEKIKAKDSNTLTAAEQHVLSVSTNGGTLDSGLAAQAIADNATDGAYVDVEAATAALNEGTNANANAQANLTGDDAAAGDDDADCEGDDCGAAETNDTNKAGSKNIELNVALPTQDGGSSNTVSIEGGAVGIMKDYIGRVYIFGTGLVIVVAVIMLIVGGIEIMVVGGIASTDSGKQRITQALLGLVLVALSALILNWINPSFFQL